MLPNVISHHEYVKLNYNSTRLHTYQNSYSENEDYIENWKEWTAADDGHEGA
jgi:hypothetical protein